MKEQHTFTADQHFVFHPGKNYNIPKSDIQFKAVILFLSPKRKGTYNKQSGTHNPYNNILFIKDKKLLNIVNGIDKVIRVLSKITLTQACVIKLHKNVNLEFPSDYYNTAGYLKQ